MRQIRNKSGKEIGGPGEGGRVPGEEWWGPGGRGGRIRLTDGHRQRRTQGECLAPADDAKGCPWKMAHPAVSVAGCINVISGAMRSLGLAVVINQSVGPRPAPGAGGSNGHTTRHSGVLAK